MKTLIRLSVVVMGMVVFASCDPKPKDTAIDTDSTAVDAVDGTDVDTTGQVQDSVAIDTTQNTK